MRALLGAVVLVASGATSSCGSDGAARSAPMFDVELGRFTIAPAVLSVPTGDVDLRVTNTDSMVHNLVVAGRGTRNLNPGETQVISVVVQPGDYRMWCDVQGHADMGQVGVMSGVPITTLVSVEQP